MKRLLFFPTFITISTIPAQENQIKLSTGQPVFASGMNLAWIHFGRDLTDFNEPEFARALDEDSVAGGNTIRWWLHVNGSESPRFDDGKVSGLNPTEIPALKKALGKPILIGEFQAKGLIDTGEGFRPRTTMTTEEAYLHAIQNGYAGCLAWTWTRHDGLGGVPEASGGMGKLKALYPEAIKIQFEKR